MSYTRKQQEKKTKKKAKRSRNNRNRNYKINKKNNKKYGGAPPALAFSTLTKTGLLGKKAISAVKVGSKLSKSNLSNVGVGLLDDALLHSSQYLFGKKEKKKEKKKGNRKIKKQKGGNAIDALKTTIETVDKIPGITFIPAYKIFSGIKDKLINLLDIVENKDIQDILNSQEMTAEEIEKRIKNYISKNENIKTEIDKYKEVCSNLDKITSLPVIGKQLDKAIPHRKELCMAFEKFNANENIDNNNAVIENQQEATDDVLENNEIIDTQETTDDVLENNENVDTQETTDDVIEDNTTEIENTKTATEDVIEETTENDTQEKENNTNFIKENTIIENSNETNDNVLENNNTIDDKNCIKTSGVVKSLTGATEFCYPLKKGGSRKSRKSHKPSRKGYRKSRKSHKKK